MSISRVGALVDGPGDALALQPQMVNCCGICSVQLCTPAPQTEESTCQLPEFMRNIFDGYGWLLLCKMCMAVLGVGLVIGILHKHTLFALYSLNGDDQTTAVLQTKMKSDLTKPQGCLMTSILSGTGSYCQTFSAEEFVYNIARWNTLRGYLYIFALIMYSLLFLAVLRMRFQQGQAGQAFIFNHSPLKTVVDTIQFFVGIVFLVFVALEMQYFWHFIGPYKSNTSGPLNKFWRVYERDYYLSMTAVCLALCFGPGLFLFKLACFFIGYLPIKLLSSVSAGSPSAFGAASAVEGGLLQQANEWLEQYPTQLLHFGANNLLWNYLCEQPLEEERAVRGPSGWGSLPRGPAQQPPTASASKRPSQAFGDPDDAEYLEAQLPKQTTSARPGTLQNDDDDAPSPQKAPPPVHSMPSRLPPPPRAPATLAGRSQSGPPVTVPPLPVAAQPQAAATKPSEKKISDATSDDGGDSQERETKHKKKKKKKSSKHAEKSDDDNKEGKKKHKKKSDHSERDEGEGGSRHRSSSKKKKQHSKGDEGDEAGGHHKKKHSHKHRDKDKEKSGASSAGEEGADGGSPKKKKHKHHKKKGSEEKKSSSGGSKKKKRDKPKSKKKSDGSD